ncbi:MAG: FG-GAP-like repeat-containing protein [Bryobacteraceae bacterium]|jgi:uncharacterized protein (TIGR03437 family)
MSRISLVWILLASSALGQSPAANLFTPAPGNSFPAGANPRFLAAGDFTGDQIADVAVVNPYSYAVTVLLGTQTGMLVPLTAPAKNVQFMKGMGMPSAVASLYFDGDTNLDLAVTNLMVGMDGTVTILLGDGMGNFTPGATQTVGQDPTGIAVADFNQDGNMDLAVANAGDASVTILFGDGKGAISSTLTQKTGIGMHPVSLAVGNFGGSPGLAVVNQLDGTVTVLIGNGTGSFTPAPGSPFPVLPGVIGPPFPYPSSVAVADVNNDGYPDIVTTNVGTGNITVLLGNALGGFVPAAGSPIAVGANPMAVTAADFNQDGDPDLAVANYGSGTVTVLLGDGKGGFTAGPGSPFASGASPASIAVGDFSGNSRLDLAVANEGDNTVTVLLNTTVPSLTVVSGASFTAPVAPGSSVTILGTNLAMATAMPPFSAPAFTLDGTSVAISYPDNLQDVLALSYVSATQINAVMPGNALTGLDTVTVVTPAGNQSGIVEVAQYAPGLFTANQNGKGVVMGEFMNALFQTSSTYQCTGTGTCVPVPLDMSEGGTLILYATGLNNAPSSSLALTVGSQQATSVMRNATSTPGMDQLTAVLGPNQLTTGLVPVILSVTDAQGTVQSNVATLLLQ